MVTPCRRAFSNPWPIVFEPSPDEFLVPLLGPRQRHLECPSQFLEQAAEIFHRIGDLKLVLNQFLNAGQAPAVRPKASRPGAFLEKSQQLVNQFL